VEPGVLVDLLRDYAHLQRLTVDRRKDLIRAGRRVLHPRDAARWARLQADLMVRIDAEDPRHITDDQYQLVMSALPALDEAGEALASGPLPLALEQGDLLPTNVFVPRPAGHYRVFDFADAAWAHPYSSLIMIAHGCIDRFQISQPDDVIDFRDERIGDVLDAYFETRADYASMAESRQLARHALRLAPLHRSSAWLRALQGLSPTALGPYGAAPWGWMEDVVKPVLL
jgi:hypothetical protein